MFRSRLTLVCCLITVAAWAAPRVASACSCGGDETLVWPLDGDVMPQGSLMFVADWTCAGLRFAQAGGFTVTVDGAEATLQTSADPTRAAGIGFEISPTPAVGSTVVIEGQGGPATITVGLADAEPPAGPTLGALDFDLVTAPLNCGEDPTPARDWMFEIEAGGPEPLLYEIAIDSDNGEPDMAYEFSGGEAVGAVVRRLAEDAGSEVCATVRTFDTSGNEAPAVSTCTTLDADDTLDPKGCSCSTGAGAGWAWAGIGVALLGLRRRRTAA